MGAECLQGRNSSLLKKPSLLLELRQDCLHVASYRKYRALYFSSADIQKNEAGLDPLARPHGAKSHLIPQHLVEPIRRLELQPHNANRKKIEMWYDPLQGRPLNLAANLPVSMRRGGLKVMHPFSEIIRPVGLEVRHAEVDCDASDQSPLQRA